MTGPFMFAGSTREERLPLDLRVTGGQVYEVLVVPRSFDGGRGALDAGRSVYLWTRGRRTQPGNVTELCASCVGGLLELSWPEVADPEVVGYEIKAGPRWTGGLPIARVAGSRFVAIADWIGTRTFRIKAVNRSGIVSDFESTVSVENPEAWYEVDASVDETAAWGGTKTDVTTSGDHLVLDVPTLAGTYESVVLNATGLDAWRVVVTVEVDIVDVPMLGSRAQVGATSPWALRHMGDEADTADWEGSENNEMGEAAAALMSGDDLYVAAGDALTLFDFQRGGVTIEVFFRTSADSGSTWSDWTKYRPSVATCDAVQAKLALSSVHADLVPRIRTLTLHLIEPLLDVDVTHA